MKERQKGKFMESDSPASDMVTRVFTYHIRSDLGSIGFRTLSP